LDKKKIRNTDKFTIELIKYFFPKYGKSRHTKNKQLEGSFQDLVAENWNQLILPQKIQLLRNRMVWNLIKRIWVRLPENIKFKIKKFIY